MASKILLAFIALSAFTIVPSIAQQTLTWPYLSKDLYDIVQVSFTLKGMTPGQLLAFSARLDRTLLDIDKIAEKQQYFRRIPPSRLDRRSPQDELTAEAGSGGSTESNIQTMFSNFLQTLTSFFPFMQQTPAQQGAQEAVEAEQSRAQEFDY